MCQIKGCLEKVEYDVHDGRPWIYHTAKDGSVHCAGANPNNKPTVHQWTPRTVAPLKNSRDHILQEYYGYGAKKKKETEEEEEDDT